MRRPTKDGLYPSIATLRYKLLCYTIQHMRRLLSFTALRRTAMRSAGAVDSDWTTCGARIDHLIHTYAGTALSQLGRLTCWNRP